MLNGWSWSMSSLILFGVIHLEYPLLSLEAWVTDLHDQLQFIHRNRQALSRPPVHQPLVFKSPNLGQKLSTQKIPDTHCDCTSQPDLDWSPRSYISYFSVSLPDQKTQDTCHLFSTLLEGKFSSSRWTGNSWNLPESDIIQNWVPPLPWQGQIPTSFLLNIIPLKNDCQIYHNKIIEHLGLSMQWLDQRFLISPAAMDLAGMRSSGKTLSRYHLKEEQFRAALREIRAEMSPVTEAGTRPDLW